MYNDHEQNNTSKKNISKQTWWCLLNITSNSNSQASAILHKFNIKCWYVSILLKQEKRKIPDWCFRNFCLFVWFWGGGWVLIENWKLFWNRCYYMYRHKMCFWQFLAGNCTSSVVTPSAMSTSPLTSRAITSLTCCPTLRKTCATCSLPIPPTLTSPIWRMWSPLRSRPSYSSIREAT